MWRFLRYTIWYAVFWLILTRGRGEAWIIGAYTVLLATVVATQVAPGQRWHWSVRGFLRFASYFMRHSVSAGVDVAWRSVHPRLPIHPALIAYDLRLPTGTVSAELEGDVLRVHVIDREQPVRAQLARLEERVWQLFGLDARRSQEEAQ